MDETELERRAARLAAARRRLAELSPAPVEPDLLSTIDRIHEQVESLERRLRMARVPALTVRVRHKLAAAQAEERELLAAHGFESWLGLQLSRVDHLLHRPRTEELEAAELEHRRALAAWVELAADVEVLPGQVASEPAPKTSTIGPCPTGWSALPI